MNKVLLDLTKGRVQLLVGGVDLARELPITAISLFVSDRGLPALRIECVVMGAVTLLSPELVVAALRAEIARIEAMPQEEAEEG